MVCKERKSLNRGGHSDAYGCNGFGELPLRGTAGKEWLSAAAFPTIFMMKTAGNLYEKRFFDWSPRILVGIARM